MKASFKVLVIVKAKNLREADMLVEYVGESTHRVRRITHIDGPGYGTEGYDIFCDGDSIYLKPNDRVAVFR